MNPDYPSPHGEGCVLPDLVCMVNNEVFLEKDEMRLWTPYNNFTLIDLEKGANEIVVKLLRRGEKLKCSIGFRQYDGNHWHKSKWCTEQQIAFL